MNNKYWTDEKKALLVELVKQKRTLAELHKQFPVRSTMSIIFAVRECSSLGKETVINNQDLKVARDSNLTYRERHPDVYKTWDKWDSDRLKMYFLQPMNIADIYLKLGRAYRGVLMQMEKLYPTAADRQKLYEDVAFYVRFKPLKKTPEPLRRVKHIILWTLNPELSEDEKQQVKQDIKSGLEGLQGKVPGLLDVKVHIDGRLDSSNCDVMLDCTLESAAALKAYAVHPAHKSMHRRLIFER